MFDIKKKERVKWFTYEDDEKYLLKYVSESDREELTKIEADANTYQSKVLTYVCGWEGIFCNGKPFECNAKNKEIVLVQQDYWSVERLKWIFSIILDYRNFFNIEDNSKN